MAKQGYGNIMLQAKRMQGQIKTLQEELQSIDFKGGAGGGLVNVVVDGRQRIQSIEITPQALNEELLGKAGFEEAMGVTLEELSALLGAAINQAIAASQDNSQDEMKKITGGIHLPGLF